MRTQINRYELKENLKEEDLLKNGFKISYYGITDHIKYPRYFLIKYLMDEIELDIEILLNPDGTLVFDDFENACVIDGDFCQYYSPFYNENADFDYVNKVIKLYNQVMDELVICGIFKEKTLNEKDNGLSRKRK